MGLTEAEEHRPPLQVLMGHFQSQRSRVKVPRFGGVTDLQHDVTELAGLNHNSPPGAKALALLPTEPVRSALFRASVQCLCAVGRRGGAVSGGGDRPRRWGPPA